jgi:hypothetical protein
VLLATERGHAEVVRLLLEKGAGTEAKDEVRDVRDVHVGCSDGC